MPLRSQKWHDATFGILALYCIFCLLNPIFGTTRPFSPLRSDLWHKSRESSSSIGCIPARIISSFPFLPNKGIRKQELTSRDRRALFSPRSLDQGSPNNPSWAKPKPFSPVVRNSKSGRILLRKKSERRKR